MMNWLGRFLDLPKSFLNSSDGPGGGVIQNSASEAILVAILTAREQAVRRIQAEHSDWTESDIRGKLVAYSSDQSNACVEKAARLGAVHIRLLGTVDSVLRGPSLAAAIAEDTAAGKIPIICIATLGTTGTCAFDNLVEVGPVCRANSIWLHIDAAYAGAALCCPEMRHLMPGIDWADSFNFNLHKLMLVDNGCCAMWLKDADKLVDAFTVDRIYLNHQHQGQSMAPDYRHWQIPLGKRFTALKVWITLRTLGADNIRAYIRQHVRLAELFEQRVRSDDRFEVVARRDMGLVCFRLRGDCALTERLLHIITERKELYMIPAKCNDKLIIRFVVCGIQPNESDMEFAWKHISEHADLIVGPSAIGYFVKPSDGVNSQFTANIKTVTDDEKHK